MTLELALDLSEQMGWKVFPVRLGEDGTKKPLTKHGHKDATADPNLIQDLWAGHEDAQVGVPAGPNNLLILDVDVKGDRDGFDSIDQAWLSIDETFDYDTPSGGRHFVYWAPEGKNLAPSTNYRGLSGVDIRAGESWVLWNGGVPDEKISEAPMWTCDESEKKERKQFAGSFEDWVEKLVPGDPNALVRRAIERIPEDFSHGEMVEAQHHAIRLACEGNSGVPELLDALYERWTNRDPANHTTPESEWEHKWFEALETGIEKYGALTDQLANLPTYNINLVPASIPLNLVTEENTGKGGFSKLLGALVKETEDDNRIAAILWDAPATSVLSRDWGLQFVFRRIAEARVRPEPTRENPRIEERRERESDVSGVSEGGGQFDLLTDDERDYLATRPGYVERVVQTAKDFGYDQHGYFRSVGWLTASMAFSFKGFIPMSQTHKMGVNLWFILPGQSGTGKSVTGSFRDAILRTVFQGDPEDIVPFDLGDDSSPQGLHAALIERDHKASLFSSDEAAGFFASLGLSDWRTSISERLTSWYNGFVQGSNKLSQKELRGKSALVSLCMHMFGTPEKLAKTIHAEMFESGFMARVIWVFGNPPRDDSSRFRISIDTSNERVDFEETAVELVGHATDLVVAVARHEKPTPLQPGEGVEDRLSEAYERMYRLSEKRENWHLVEPSLTRLSESMLKMAGLSALYRGDTTIQMEDALRSIGAMEEYFENLHRMAALVSAGQFQQRAEEIEAWVRGKGGKASRASIYHRFRGFIERSSRELDDLLVYLTESGSLNRVEGDRGAVSYEMNGGS